MSKKDNHDEMMIDSDGESNIMNDILFDINQNEDDEFFNDEEDDLQLDFDINVDVSSLIQEKLSQSSEEPSTSTTTTTTSTPPKGRKPIKTNATAETNSLFQKISKQTKFADDEDNEEEFDIDKISQLSKSSKKSSSSLKNPRIRTSARSRDLARLPKATKDLISLGMSQYTTGKSREAFNTFNEVIKISPNYPRTYTMMSLIKRDQGDHAGECDFLYIAAEIGTNIVDLWRRCAILSKELGNNKRAIRCYRKVLKLDQEDLESWYSLSSVYELEKNYKKALTGFRYLHQKRPQDTAVIQQLVQIYSAIDKVDEAIVVMESVIEGESKKDFYDMDLDSFNIILELYNRARYFEKTIDMFQKIRAIFPDNLSIAPDLVYSAAVAYFNVGDMQLANICYKQITKHNINDIADLYYKLGATLVELNFHDRALPLFLDLLKADNVEKHYIWYYLGIVYKAIKNNALAIKYLQDCINIDPTNKKACLLLSDIYKEVGDHEKSLQVLTQINNLTSEDDSEISKFEKTLSDLESKRQTITPQDVLEYYRVAEDYLNLSKYSQFLGIVRALFNGSNDEVRLKKKTLLGSRAKKDRNKRKYKSRDNYIRYVSFNTTQPFAEKLEEKEYFNMLINTCKVLCLIQRSDEASKLLRYTLRNIKFFAQTYFHQLNFLLVGIAFNESKPMLAFSHFKYVCSKKPYSNRIWNLFNKVVLRSKGDYYYLHKKYITELLSLNPNSIPLRIISGNSYKTTGNAKSALVEYLLAFKIDPKQPLVILLLAVTILCQSMGRKNPDRHKIVLNAFAFFYKYKQIRETKELQEVHYNLGRAAQQLGIFYLAIEYYQRVLDSKEEEDPNYSLKQEAAFNLSRIYEKDNPTLAANLINQYCTI